MMDDVKIVGTLDVTELLFYAFVFFFIGLVIYLQREGRREGYPLEDETTGRVDTPGGILSMGSPKTFRMPFGRPDITVPNGPRDTLDRPWARTFRSPGAPYYPTGNPLVDGIGPAAWADRAKHTDLDGEGRARIVPIGAAEHISVHAKDSDPRGMSVIAADGSVADAGTSTGALAVATSRRVALEAGAALPAADTPVALARLSRGLRTAPPPMRSTCV